MKKKNYKVKLKVKELLEERNITQKKLAQISGIRESTISERYCSRHTNGN